MTVDSYQFERARSGRGFIAALDQSVGSTPRALARYGVPPAPTPTTWPPSGPAGTASLGHQQVGRSARLRQPAFGLLTGPLTGDQVQGG